MDKRAAAFKARDIVFHMIDKFIGEGYAVLSHNCDPLCKDCTRILVELKRIQKRLLRTNWPEKNIEQFYNLDLQISGDPTPRLHER